MKARIPFNKELFDKSSRPFAYISEKKGKGIFTLTIEVDLHAGIVKYLEDHHDANATEKAQNREALIGSGIMSLGSHITELKISVDDPINGPCNFSLKGKLDTKVPGTGE
jgi:hypothetical protein